MTGLQILGPELIFDCSRSTRLASFRLTDAKRDEGNEMQIGRWLAISLLVVGCVSIADEDERRASLTRQSFNADYQFAVTSWFREDVLTPVSFRAENPKGDVLNTTIAKMDRVLAKDGSDWSYFQNNYNNELTPSVLEQNLADRLEGQLGVEATFIPRIDVAKAYSGWDSPAFIAKGIAQKNGYDAFAIIYFRPRVTILNEDASRASEDEIKYAMTYDYTFVVRSVADDLLLYFIENSVSCGFSEYDEYKLSGGAVIRREKENPDAIPQNLCEEAIQAEIVEAFVSHIETVRR